MSAPTRACTISGAGGPTKIGSGTLVLPGANTHSGGISLRQA
jgi:autotransporter-associated beta strand protein